MPSSTVFSCKAHALLVLVECALKSLSSPLFADSTSEGGNVSDLVGLLIDIATMYGSLGLDKSANAIHQAARSCLSQAVGVTPALGLMASCSRCWNQERAESVTIYRVTYPAPDSLQIKAVVLDLLADRSGDAGTAAQPLVIGLYGRPFRQFDRRRRHGPVDDRDEIRIGYAEMVEQEFPILQIVLEIVETRQALAENVGLHIGRRVAVEHWHE